MYMPDRTIGVRSKNNILQTMQKFLQKWGLAYLFLVPALVLIILFLFYPTAQSVILSLQKWSGLGKPVYIGLKNYKDLFKSDMFASALVHTFTYSFGSVIFSVLIGLSLALAIERRVFGWQFYKFVFYISVMMSTSVVAILFIQLLEPNYGIINNVLKASGLGSLAHSWLADPDTALGTLIAISSWKNSGFTMLLFLAAMEGIDTSIHEAATLDGVTVWKRIIYIILPIIKRPIFVVVMLQIIFSLKAFDLVWIITRGGPGGATESVTTLLFKNATQFGKYGYASAISVTMIVIISVITLGYLRLSRLDDQIIE